MSELGLGNGVSGAEIEPWAMANGAHQPKFIAARFWFGPELGFGSDQDSVWVRSTRFESTSIHMVNSEIVSFS